jgi:hypothetical protein
MVDVLGTENRQSLIPKSKHFVALALIPALAVSVPYAYLLWDESNHYDVPFWGADLFILLGAPVVGYGSSGLLIWFFRESIEKRKALYWGGISVVGSFVALAILLVYFYSLGSLHLGWKRTAWNASWIAGGLSIYSSAFTAAYFYATIRRSPK